MTYTFDRVGNVMATENRATGKTIRQEYGYDDLDELTSANGWYEDRRPGGVTVRHDYQQTFEYDMIGNMTTKTSRHMISGGRGKRELNYSFGYAYEKARPHCAVTIGEYGYVYDVNGNVTEEVYGSPAPEIKRSGNEDMGGDDGDPTTGSDGFAYGEVEPAKPTPGTILRSYVWDDENRMVEAVAGNERVFFGYDAAGERTVKYTEHGETVYVDRMYQVEPTKNPNVYTKHIFVGETRLVSRIGNEGQAYGGQNGEMYYYHPDHLGNTTWVTDNAGTEYEHVEYAPYGESWVDEGRDSLDRINHLFTSKELDKETGLYYFGARYLDPKTSRWMSADPAMEKYLPEAPVDDEAKKRNGNLPGMGGVFNVFNLAMYHYSGNNPLKYKDPNGKEPRIGSEDLKSDWAGEAILRHYLLGGGEDMIHNNDPAWTSYIERNQNIQDFVKAILFSEAIGIKKGATKNISITAHAEIENGESIIGYQYMHGTDATVGDFKIHGNIEKKSDGTIIFNMTYVWNDIMNKNSAYATDNKKEAFARSISSDAKPFRFQLVWSDLSIMKPDGSGTGWVFTNVNNIKAIEGSKNWTITESVNFWNQVNIRLGEGD